MVDTGTPPTEVETTEDELPMRDTGDWHHVGDPPGWFVDMLLTRLRDLLDEVEQK